MLEQADDLKLDVPDFDVMVSKFLARAVADEILPPVFLSDPLVESLGGQIVHQAKVMLRYVCMILSLLYRCYQE